MNVIEGLTAIRVKLEDNEADPATLQCVDLIIRRASLPAAAPATANSQLQLLHMLMRTPVANNNIKVYNDFLKVEEELDKAAADARERRAAEDARPVPKTKKYYKDLKERQKKEQSKPGR